MNFTDTKENTIFKYFYVSKFTWTNPLAKEENQGHPKENRVYRGWLNTDTNSYRLNTTQTGALWVSALVNSDETIGYTSEIHELNLGNILDFKITEEDLDNLIKWHESGNSDLKALVYGKGPQGVPIEIVRLIQDKVSGENNIDGFLESIEELEALNPLAFISLWELTDYMLDEMYEESSIDAENLRTDPTHSSSINIYKAMESLSRYIGPNRKTNKDRTDLLKALSAILLELSLNEEF